MLVKFIYKNPGPSMGEVPSPISLLLHHTNLFFLKKRGGGSNNCIDYSYKPMEWGTTWKKGWETSMHPLRNVKGGLYTFTGRTARLGRGLGADGGRTRTLHT